MIKLRFKESYRSGHRVILSLICLCALTTLSACGGDPLWLPRAHKISVQQGNLLDEQQLAKVETGMSREVVRNLIGTPVTNTPFRANRWDYLFTEGPAGSAIEAKRVSIFFEDNVVARIEGNQNEVSGVLPPNRYFWEPRDD